MRSANSFSVVLLKPDCLERGLVDKVLEMTQAHFEVVAQKRLLVKEEQILRHYDGLIRLLGDWAREELCQMYVGKEVVVLLVRGDEATIRMRDLVGGPDPAAAAANTIRGRFGDDSYDRARAEGRLVNNLIHASDSADSAEREFRIWLSGNDHV